MTQKIVLYDTTLRDGTQAEDVNLSTPDKIKIALRLDEFGIDYIEGGWPGSNPVDVAFFKEIANYHLKYARIAAFGSTHHPDNKVEEDPNLNALIASGATAGTIFGKSCERHAKEALRLDPKRNLDIIRNSVAYLKRSMPEVYFDAEHFFDGYKRNAEYSLAVLRAAHEAGALIINLCDTNGGTLPNEMQQIVSDLRVACRKCGSASIRTTTARWRWRIPSLPCRLARKWCRARSMGWASAAAMPTCARSSRYCR